MYVRSSSSIGLVLRIIVVFAFSHADLEDQLTPSEEETTSTVTSEGEVS